jgi:hypothetical protein
MTVETSTTAPTTPAAAPAKLTPLQVAQTWWIDENRTRKPFEGGDMLTKKMAHGMTGHHVASVGCIKDPVKTKWTTEAWTSADLDALWESELARKAAGEAPTAYWCDRCLLVGISVRTSSGAAKKPATAKAKKVSAEDAPTELDKVLTEDEKAKMAAQVNEMPGARTETPEQAAEGVKAVEEARLAEELAAGAAKAAEHLASKVAKPAAPRGGARRTPAPKTGDAAAPKRVRAPRVRKTV